MFKRKITPTPNAGFYADVLLCCMPLLAMSYVLYGPRPVILAGISCAMAYLFDRLLAPLHGPDYDSGEMSSQCFAVLLTLLMPANVSAYVLAFAVISAVVIKEVFGGAGHYPFNPAAVGYAIAAVSWPNEIFQYPAVGKIPITGTGSLVLYESASATLRSGGLPNLTTTQLLVGNYAGPLGTGFVLIILAEALYLLVRRRISLYTVLSYLFACAAIVWLFPRTGSIPAFSAPWTFVTARLTSLKFEMLSGAMIFGGVFLICEPVTQPKTNPSRLAYGFLLGILATMFRYFGVYETGICFALLIINALSNRLDIIVAAVTQLLGITEPKKAAVPQTAVRTVKPKRPKPVQEETVELGNTQLMDTMALDARMMTPMTQTLSKEEVQDALQETPPAPKPAAPHRRKQRFQETAKTLMIPAIQDELIKERKEGQNGQ